MNLFRRPKLMSVINAVLALMMIMVAGRSEASCFSLGLQPGTHIQMMENCADMEASQVGSDRSVSTHHSDDQQAGMCHYGCPIFFKVAVAQNYHFALHSLKFLRELEPMTVGINAVPQTPPPKF
jgi:hypothetical protein